jgi:hypothetical protein
MEYNMTEVRIGKIELRIKSRRAKRLRRRGISSTKGIGRTSIEAKKASRLKDARRSLFGEVDD